MAGYPPPYPPAGPPSSNHDWQYQRRLLKEQARAQRDYVRAQRDAYRARVRGMRRGSIVGPILVVALGVVFLLVQLGRLHSESLWSWYGRWWPLLLIGIGIVLLVEWAFDRNAQTNSQREGNVPYVRHGLGGGVVALLIFLVLAGLSFDGFRNGQRNFFTRGFNINSDNLDQFLGDKHESDETRLLAFPANTALNVTNPRGDITISGTSDDNQIHIAIHKEVYTRSDSDAENQARQLSPQINTSPNGSFGTMFNLSLPQVEGTHADMVISVPPAAPVTVTANHGDVHVNAIKAPVLVTANHGDIELSAITGGVTARIHNGSSSFSAHSITGPVSVEGRGHDLTLTDIDGPVSLNGDFFGDTHLERIRGTVKFHTSRTDFQLARLDGELNISSSDISAAQAQGPVTLTTRSRNISLEKIAGDLSVSNSNGSIDLTAAPPLGNVTIDNRSGSVNLTVPEQASFTVQAQTSNGDIENDFALPTQENNNRKNFGGTVGKGGSLIRIHTSEGDIALKKANLAPLPPTPPRAPSLSMSSPTGESIVLVKDGTRITTGPDGSTLIVRSNGTRITSGPDGSKVFLSHDGTQLTSGPDGSKVYKGRDGTRFTSSPDGSKVYVGPNGVRITTSPDGNKVGIGPNGKTLNDHEINDQLRRAEEQVTKAEEQRRQQSTVKNQ